MNDSKKTKQKELTIEFIYENDDEKFIEALYQIYLHNLNRTETQSN